MLRLPALLALLASLAAACGDDGGAMGTGDGGGADGGDGGAGLFMPTPPALPILTPCPEGWRVVTTDSDLEVCEPWPEGGAASCGPGEAHFPGEAGCAPVGADCPAGDYADLPADAVALYVAAGASGGDGSLVSPFGAIRDAARAAAGGTIIAVGRGRFVEEVSLGSGVELRGACAAETTMGSESAVERVGALTITGVDVVVRDLSVSGSLRRGIQVRAGATAHLEGVIIEDNDSAGLVVLSGATLTGRRIVVRANLWRASSRVADGVLVDGADVDLSEVVVEANVGVGVTVAGTGGTLRLSDALIRDQEASATGEVGRGMNIAGGTHVELSRALLEDNRDNGILIGQSSSLAATDLIVRRTAERTSDLTRGRGLMIQDGATVALTRTLLDENRESQMITIGEGTSVHAEDFVIRRSRPRAADMAYGRGTDVEYGGDLEIVRGVIEQVYDVGIFSNEADTALRLEDVTVRDVALRQNNLSRGRGIEVQLGAQADMTRVAVERTQELGIMVADLSSLTMRDSAIRDVAGLETGGGRGVNIQQRVEANVDGLLVERTRDLGVFVGGATAQATIRRLVVHDTLPLRCADSGCAEASFGIGLGLYDGSVVDLADFDIARASLCGLHFAGTLMAAIRDGAVRESLIGACVQVEGFDFDTLAATVRFVDNGVNLDATSLPIPEQVALP